ncbi:MAG: hypothetical protein M3160_05515 [Candidatus Eremiobacteraeota bacterium]|nr:hypothetical protein [Candidatus Eremiobacteraeota bacterium]
MRSFFSFSIGALCALALASPVSASTVTLPAGTRVSVRLVQSISSGNATVGQRIPIQAAAPVVLGDRVIIAKGAGGMGRVESVSKAHGKSAGQMTFEFVSIHSVDGSRIALSAIPRDSHGNAEKGKASTATIAATIALGPIGLLAHNLVKGKDITIDTSRTFGAWVRSNAMVTTPQ